MRLLLYLMVLFTFGTIITTAQEEDCALDEQLVLQAVENVCATVGANEVCYGNFQVNAIPRDPAMELVFANPGDSTNLANLRSLYLSSLNPTTNTWGIAQMRLLITAPEGLQDVNMLLFGDVTIENASDVGVTFDVAVRTVAADILNTPDPAALVLGTVDSGVVLTAVGRTTDTFWLQVQHRDTGNTGWVATELVRAVDPASNFEGLPVHDTGSTYYGPMQAFYFSNGSSGDCANIASDGLLIQTPEGVARVSLLINEVSIELNASATGEGATAFVQANPDEEEGMSINVLTGEATVQAEEGEPQVVTSGMRTSIPLSLDLSPRGAPSPPQTFDPQSIRVDSFLPALRAPAVQRPLVDSSGNLNLSLPASGTGNGSTQSGTGGGVGITGSGSGDSGTGSTSGSGSATGGSSADSNTSGTIGGSLTSGLTGSTGTQGTDQPIETTPTEGIGVVNAIALGLLVLVAMAFLFWLIRYTTRSDQP